MFHPLPVLRHLGSLIFNTRMEICLEFELNALNLRIAYEQIRESLYVAPSEITQ